MDLSSLAVKSALAAPPAAAPPACRAALPLDADTWARGLAAPAVDELALASLDHARLREHAARFPATVQTTVERDVLRRW
jgi:hypothetical protein